MRRVAVWAAAGVAGVGGLLVVATGPSRAQTLARDRVMPLLVFLCVLVPGGCARGFVAHGPVPLAVDQDQDGRALYVQWLGASSWIISRGRDIVVVDPFFSRPRLGSVMLSLAVPGLARGFGYDVERINDVLPDLPRDTRFVLIGHGHYDHLMDVAYYMKRRSGQGARYVGSASARNVLLGFKPAHLDFSMAEPGRSTERGGVRVTAFPSDHAPHVLGLKLMSGEVGEPKASFPAAAGEYLEGQTQVYFVDFLDASGAVTARVFVNSAASSPEGASVLREHLDFVRKTPTNIAILCVPGWNKVEDYPESILRLVNPEHVVLSHYDDFFSPYRNGEDPKSGMRFVAFADYPGFLSRLETLRQRNRYRYEVHQPKTGQCLRFPRVSSTLPCQG